MEPQACTIEDLQQIRADIVAFWGSDRTLGLHTHILVHEFGRTAFVIKDGPIVVAYLFGFLSQTTPTGYIHLIAVRESHQRKGLGHRLYSHFTDYAKANGCTALKAITTPTNAKSIGFHTKLGMQLLGEPNAQGIPVIVDYHGKGEHRVVFHRAI